MNRKNTIKLLISQDKSIAFVMANETGKSQKEPSNNYYKTWITYKLEATQNFT
jgi:hypothetical protein